LAADLTFTTPTEADLDELAANMRPEDRDEIVASDGPDVRKTLAVALGWSVNALAVRSKDGLLCVFGTAAPSLLGDEAAPWMLGTDILARHPRTLTRVARRYIEEMLGVFPVLVNHVDTRNTASIRLLAWLGFTFDEPRPYGVAGLPFRRFEKRA
jgi:hypothetical protein